jgi:hypothetical protein
VDDEDDDEEERFKERSWRAGMSGADETSIRVGVSLRSSSKSASSPPAGVDEAVGVLGSWSAPWEWSRSDVEMGGIWTGALARVEVHSMTWGTLSLKSIEWRLVWVMEGFVAGVRKLVDVISESAGADPSAKDELTCSAILSKVVWNEGIKVKGIRSVDLIKKRARREHESERMNGNGMRLRGTSPLLFFSDG